jgi:hypothetical protein
LLITVAQCGLRRGSWSLGYLDRGFESRSRHGCLPSSFGVEVFCVGRGLVTVQSVVQGVLPTVEKRYRNLKQGGGQGSQRTVEPQGEKARSTNTLVHFATYERRNLQ